MPAIRRRAKIGKQINLSMIVHGDPVTGKPWPTPTSKANQGAPSTRDRGSACRNMNENARGSLNPDWVEWLMGFPVGWTDLDELVGCEILSWETDPADAMPPDSLPTPRGQDGYERRNRKTMERIAREGGDMTLPTRVKTWPTPRAAADKMGRPRPNDRDDIQAAALTHGTGHGPIPRVSTGTAFRRERLTALGNGQVPLCAATAWRMLVGALDE